mgnify:CR=1 FL=1
MLLGLIPVAASAEGPNSGPITSFTSELEVSPGDTLDALLADANLDAPLRAEIALAVRAEYDPRQLRPGHRLILTRSADGIPQTVTLVAKDGLRVEIVFGETVKSRTIAPETRVAERASEFLVEGSVFASLYQAGVPARFAVDIAQMLGGTVDFRRDLQGGETVQLLWQEEVRPDGVTVGQPQLTYAALGLAEARFEIVWPQDEGAGAMIFMDGELVRAFLPPVDGARLSSVFGQRRHPVYGYVRMHTGVDFAAPRGAPIRATAPGRISFVGRRDGYGRVVEISHGPEMLTRYAHLSAVPDGVEVGQLVNASEIIGLVGATGTTTGPNLHYEVLVQGKPVDPMNGERIAEIAKTGNPNDASVVLAETRVRLASILEGHSDLRMDIN